MLLRGTQEHQQVVFSTLVEIAGQKNRRQCETFVREMHELTCKEGSHFWGSEMWDPSLPANSSAYQTLVVGCCLNGTRCGA